MFDYFVPPNLKFHNQYCPNYQVFPQHPTQQAPQDPMEDENDTDVKSGLLRILQINDFCDWLTTLPNTRLGIKQTHNAKEEQRNARIMQFTNDAMSLFDTMRIFKLFFRLAHLEIKIAQRHD